MERYRKQPKSSMSKCLGVILGGGRGSRLYPLTKYRCKPAVPLGGSYRLIDIPVSNCIHSGLNKIFILSQYHSASLNRHIAQSYQFDIFRGGFVEILAAEQTSRSNEWFQGTADAVRRNLRHFRSYEIDHYLILAGDHLYRMDYEEFVQHHIRTGADITVGVYPVDAEQASSFGILKVNSRDQIVDFVEKPKDPEVLKKYRAPTGKRNTGTRGEEKDKAKDYLASMGIYIFNRDILHRCLENREMTDFGKHMIPNAIHEYKVMGFPFEGYWEDIGTIRSFYEANLAMADPNPPFAFQGEEGPIYTHPRYLPGSRVEDCTIRHAMLASGCEIREAQIERSVIGVRSVVVRGCRLENVVMMGADYTETPAEAEKNREEGIPNIGIGENSVIQGAIIDKNARIGENVTIENREGIEEAEGEGYSIKEGIVVVEKNAVIPDGLVI